MTVSFFLLVCVCVDTGSPVAQADLDLTMKPRMTLNSLFSISQALGAGITGERLLVCIFVANGNHMWNLNPHTPCDGWVLVCPKVSCFGSLCLRVWIEMVQLYL